MKPAARKGFRRRLLVLEISLHHHIAAEHDLAHGLAVARHFFHRLRVAHGKSFQHGIGHALPRLHLRALLRVELVPFVVPGVYHGGPVGFGEPINMDHVEALRLELADRRGGRRRGGGEIMDCVRQRFLLVLARIDEETHHGRRPRHMRHAVLGDGAEDVRRRHAAKAHMRSRDDAQGPGEAPAIAMEHRHRPEIDGSPRHARGDDVAHGEEMRAAMVIDDAFRVAGRARCVVEADRLPFVGGQLPVEVRVAARDEIFVFRLADPGPRPVIFLVVHVDHNGLHLGQRQRLLHKAGKLPVHEDHLRFSVIEDETDRRRVEPRIDRIENGAGHRHAVMHFEHGGRVRRDHGHGCGGGPHAQRRASPDRPPPRA